MINGTGVTFMDQPSFSVSGKFFELRSIKIFGQETGYNNIFPNSLLAVTIPQLLKNSWYKYKLNWLRIHGENWYGTKRKFYNPPAFAILFLFADVFIVDRISRPEFWRENAKRK